MATRAPHLPLRVGGCLTLALFAGACHKKAAEGDDEHKAPVEVHCVAATRGVVEEKLILRGRLTPPPGGDLPVASQVAGRVTETRVHEGDRLAKGTVVAIVDDLAPRAAASQAGAALARVKAADVAAESALRRARDLAALRAAPSKDVEEAVARAAAAHAEVDAETAALRLASGTLGRVDVRTTFDGVVTRVFRGPGALVDGTAATPILQIAAVDTAELVADATERELARVQEGQKAEILLATGGKLAGAVIARARALDPSTGLGAVRIRIEKVAAGEGVPASPPIGAFALVTLVLGQREGAMMLPASALRGAAADGAEIAICKGDKVEIRTVTVGYREPRRIEIAEGLKEGEKVAVDHVLGLDEETTITEAKGELAEEKDGDDDHKGKGDDEGKKKGAAPEKGKDEKE
jgi:HlyD family secretion protein